MRQDIQARRRTRNQLYQLALLSGTARSGLNHTRLDELHMALKTHWQRLACLPSDERLCQGR